MYSHELSEDIRIIFVLKTTRWMYELNITLNVCFRLDVKCIKNLYCKYLKSFNDIDICILFLTYKKEREIFYLTFYDMQYQDTYETAYFDLVIINFQQKINRNK